MRRWLAIGFLLVVLATRLLMSAAGAGNFAPPATVPPFDDSWSRSGSNPIITADEGWDQDAVVEPVVTYELGAWKMWYRGGWDTEAIGYATSSDGIAWTKYGSNPVYGSGGSGEAAHIACPWIVKIGATYYLYGVKAPFTVGNTVAIATSSDGIAWTTQAATITLPGGTNLWGNVVVWKEGATWQMLHEAAPTASSWRIYRYTSANGLSWSIANGGAAYGSLQVAANGAYGGPKFANIAGIVTPKFGGTYHLWYHAAPGAGNLPTNIYHATSTDLTTDSWTQTSPNPVLAHAGSGFEVDQVAGPSPVVVGGTAYLFYDGDDNTGETASIAVATAPATH